MHGRKKEKSHSRSEFEDERKICNLQSQNLNRVWTESFRDTKIFSDGFFNGLPFARQ